jgi:methylmalonyl-CoA/ethylmalonyl-CoA epimerase
MRGTWCTVELHQVAQRADDLDRAVASYSGGLGCETIASFDPPGMAFFHLGESRLLYARAVGLASRHAPAS